MFIKQQEKLKNVFQLSFFSLLLVGSSIVIFVGEQHQAFSQSSEEEDTNSATQPTDFLTYENATYGVTIQYPSDWIVDTTDYPDDPLTQIVGFFLPLESRVDTYEERLWIAQEQQSFSEDFDLAQYAEQIVSNYNSTLTDFSLDEIDTETATLGNNDSPAYRMVYTERLQPENIDLKTLEIGTLIGDKIYVVMYHAETARYDQYLPIIEEMISSLELISDMAVFEAPTTPQAEDNATATVQEEQQQVEDWLRYENTTYGVSILYPSTWTQQYRTAAEQGEGFIILSDFTSPQEADGSFAEVSIVVENLSANMAVEDYLDATIDVYTQADSPHQIISSGVGDITLAGMPAYSLETTYTDPEFGPQRFLEVGTIVDSKVYYIRYFAEPHIYQKYLPTVEEMINSIQLSDSEVDSAASAETDLEADTDGDIATQEEDDGGTTNTVTVENQTEDISTNQQENIGAAQLAPNIDFLRYETSFEEETLSIEYPSDWQLQEFQPDPNANYNDIAAFMSPILSITDPYQDFVLLSVEKFANQNMTLEEYLEYTIAVYNGSEALPSSQVISYSDDVFLTSKNYPAYQVEFTYRSDQDNRQLRVIEIGTVIEDKAYFVSYYASDDRGFSQLMPIAQQMFESLEINEAKRTRGVSGTMPDPGSQYLELSYDEWRSDNINVMLLVNPDTEEQSSRYVEVVENAINSWSQALKQYSGNPNAWNFNVSTSVGYLSSLEVGPGQQADLIIELAGDPEGVIGCQGFIGVAPPHPYELTIPVTVHVLTSCLDTETGELIEYSEEVVYSTALHEFAHALGLGHAFNINNDLMCSAEVDINGNLVPTCEFFEVDVIEISEADVAALVYKYGTDGFEPPNTELRGPRPFYEVGLQTVAQ